MAETRDNEEAYYRSQSYWLDTVPGRLDPRPALDRDATADVVIVGAGYTGLWTAYYLKTHAPHLDVAICEADIAGFGASGRNGGWCSGYSDIDHWIDDPVTREGGLALQRLLFAAVDEVGRVSCLENIDCHFEKSGAVCAAVNAAQLNRARSEVETWHSDTFNEDDIRLLDAGQVRERVNIHGTLGGYFVAHCAAIHPAALVRGLAKAVVAKGARLYEGTPVTVLTEGGVRTPGGTLKADVVLLATEGFTDTIEGLERRLTPIHSMMIATERLTEAEIEATGLRRRYTWNDLQHQTTYGQLTRDGRIAFGFRGRYYFGAKRHTLFSPDDPLFAHTRAALIGLFPVLRDKAITHAWGGPMGVPRKMHPAVVFDRERGAGWAGGYFGDGVGASNLAGRTLADLVLERDTERCQTPWVNPPGFTAPPARSWEPEPLRWLAINATKHALGAADRAEARGGKAADRWNWALENVFP
ncbi:MAG: FAD-binding oxidoreductase [Pseudomonadota bacterium]